MSLCFARSAHADAKQECSEAYQKTQVLKDADKLEEALAQAQICQRDVCTKFIRDDCTNWKKDIEAKTASIVVEVVDTAGAPVTEGSASLDGDPFLDPLDTNPHVVGKGPHTLVVTVKGAAPRTEALVVREGEKNRKITITVDPKAVPNGTGTGPGGGAAEEETNLGPWVLGGVGLGVLVAGAVTGGIVVADYGTVQKECDDKTELCTEDGESAEHRGQILGPTTTVLLVGGTALVAAGVIWLVVDMNDSEPSDPTTTSFFVAPTLSTDEQGIVVGGRW